LPELADELQSLLKETESQVRKLPAGPSDDAQGEVLLMVSGFVRDLATYVEGTPDDNGIHQAIRPLNEMFREEIRATAQRFSPFERFGVLFTGGHHTPVSVGHGYTHPKFLQSEEEPVIQASDDDAICVNEVMEMAKK
jgi:hypothetical protein